MNKAKLCLTLKAASFARVAVLVHERHLQRRVQHIGLGLLDDSGLESTHRCLSGEKV